MFELFVETEEPQIMPYPNDDLPQVHELWQKANGACNAAKFAKEEAIRKARLARLRDEANAPTDLSDIDTYFEKNGGGTHFLEYDFTPDTEEKQFYISKTTGIEKSYWCWTHKYTEYSVKRYGSANGKYIDSGRLSKYLAMILEQIIQRLMLELNIFCF
jgi:hypothetical protein